MKNAETLKLLDHVAREIGDAALLNLARDDEEMVAMHLADAEIYLAKLRKLVDPPKGK